MVIIDDSPPSSHPLIKESEWTLQQRYSTQQEEMKNEQINEQFSEQSKKSPTTRTREINIYFGM